MHGRLSAASAALSLPLPGIPGPTSGQGCLYGSYNIECEYDIPMDKVVQFFCPHCHAELRGGVDCSACGAPMVPMIVRGGGMLQICSRRGCKAHMLDLNGVNF